MKPRLLDLFCGAGGCSVGYQRAGFDVVGVDVVPQPSYPYEFHQADALTFPLDGFDAIHASPPCKRFTVARRVHTAKRPTLFDPHPDLLSPTRERLAGCGVPWVIENVPGAPLVDPVVLCGSSFGLRVRRHRLFESNVALVGSGCRHDEQPHPVGVYGNGGAWTRTAPGGGGVKVAGADAADALGIDWTDRQPELAQAIPPAYTEWIGTQLLAALPCGAAPEGEKPSMTPHKCPVCDGAGHTWRPPWIPGDQQSWPSASIESYPCKPCDGTGIVWAEGESA